MARSRKSDSEASFKSLLDRLDETIAQQDIEQDVAGRPPLPANVYSWPNGTLQQLDSGGRAPGARQEPQQASPVARPQDAAERREPPQPAPPPPSAPAHIPQQAAQPRPEHAGYHGGDGDGLGAYRPQPPYEFEEPLLLDGALDDEPAPHYEVPRTSTYRQVKQKSYAPLVAGIAGGMVAGIPLVWLTLVWLDSRSQTASVGVERQATQSKASARVAPGADRGKAVEERVRSAEAVPVVNAPAAPKTVRAVDVAPQQRNIERDDGPPVALGGGDAGGTRPGADVRSEPAPDKPRDRIATKAVTTVTVLSSSAQEAKAAPPPPPPPIRQLIAADTMALRAGETASLPVRIHPAPDGEARLRLVVAGVPREVTVNPATASGQGLWSIKAGDLGQVTIKVAQNAQAVTAVLGYELVDEKGNSLARSQTQLSVTPAPAPVVATAPPAPPAAPPKRAEVQRPKREAEVLVERGREIAATGDISGARLLYERAADGGSGRAALLLAQSYDPRLLAQQPVFGMAPDLGKARYWYGVARDLGVQEAEESLARLPQ